ncbi:MAG: hypothetical protein RL757_1545 [Bacteroidota bacterium]|jgi:outer membrane protein TolC
MKIFQKTILLTFILGGGLFANFAVAQDNKMTLEQAIEYAQTHVNSIKAAEESIKDADLQIKQSKAAGLPQVNAELGYQFYFARPQALFPDFFTPAVSGILAGYGVKDGRGNPIVQLPAGAPSKVSFVQRNQLTAGVTASQLVFSGSYLVALKAAKLYRNFVDVQLESKKSDVRYQVTDVYLPVLLVNESVKTLDNNITNLEKLFSDTKAILKAGFAEQLDADRLELAIATLKTERENLLRQKDIILNGLKMVMGYPLEQPLDVADDVNKLMLNGINVSENLRYDQIKSYQVVNSGIELQKLNIELNQKSALPTVAAFVSWQESIVSNNYFTESTSRLPTGLVGIKATYNIWDNHERLYKIDRARLAVRQLELQRGDLERALTMQVLNARIAITTAQKRLASQQKNLELAERIYKTTQIKYKEGVGSSFEMVSAEQQVYQSQQNVRQSQFDLLQAQRNLMKALGK